MISREDNHNHFLEHFDKGLLFNDAAKSKFQFDRLKLNPVRKKSIAVLVIVFYMETWTEL